MNFLHVSGMLVGQIFFLLVHDVAASFTNDIAMLPKRDSVALPPNTVGWRSTTTIGASTSYVPHTCSPGLTWYASGDATQYGGCCPGASCSAVATGCTGGYKVFSGPSYTASSSYCAVSCYRDLVLQSFGDTAPPTYMFWCGTLSTGATLYRTSPEGQPAATVTDSGTFQRPTMTSTLISSFIDPAASLLSSGKVNSSSKTSLVGPIAGAIGGGVFFLVLVTMVVIFIRRRRSENYYQHSYPDAYFSNHRSYPKPVVHEMPQRSMSQSRRHGAKNGSRNEVSELHGSEPLVD